MNTERWRKLEEIFESAAGLSGSELETFIASRTADDPELRDELHGLLEHDARPNRLGEIVHRMREAIEPDWAGRRVGSFLLVREIGRGGMGVVFEGKREDPFHQTVAVKICGQAPYSSDFRARFARERQILARLRHPHVVQLLDGGSTAEGVPYFVMERVEGQPIQEFGVAQNLPATEKIALFLKVCDAVEYAHQHFIVHRDLKPSNILVDAAGNPKVLDFGIAKMLESTPEASGETATAFAPVTPDYCTPEQVLADPITTRTDVYQLGLILFELLTGRRAQFADTSSPAALENAICRKEMPLASEASGNKALAGDLDTIIAVATSKDPQRRYASAAALASDLANHLANRPISARRDSGAYRIGKFLRRNRLAAAAVAAIVISVLAGLLSTLHQARRSARRFELVRGIARVLMFDVHTAVEHLPGSVKARNVVIRAALDYLNALSRESGGDDDLQFELAEGYSRIGQLQAVMVGPGLGQREEGVRNLQKARALIDPLYRKQPTAKRIAESLASIHQTLAEVSTRTGNLEEGRKQLEQVIPILRKASDASPDDASLQRTLAQTLFFYNRDVASRGNPNFEHASEPIKILERLLSRSPNDPDLLVELAQAYSGAGRVYFNAKKSAEALPFFEECIRLRQKWVQLQPNNVQAHRNLMLAYAALGDTYWGYSFSLGDRDRAMQAFRHMSEQAEWLLAADPRQPISLIDHAMGQMRYASAMPPRSREAVNLFTKAVAEMEEAHKVDPENLGLVRQYMPMCLRLADRQLELGNRREAVALWRKSIAMGEAAADRDKSDPAHRTFLLSSYEPLAKELLRQGDKAGAASLATRASVRMAEAQALSATPASNDLFLRTREWMAKVGNSRTD